MKIKMALTLAALAGALFSVTPASAAPVGAAGQSAKADKTTVGLVENVHSRWRRHHRHQNYAYRYRPYRYSYYQPYYSSYYRPYYSSYNRPYYSSYYSPYYYGGYGGGYYGHHRRGGLSIQFGF